MQLDCASTKNRSSSWGILVQNLHYMVTLICCNQNDSLVRWWRHQMETFSALLTICAGNSPLTGEFPAQRPVTRSFDVFFDLRLNKRLSKQSWCWWFETLSRPLWRHCNEFGIYDTWGICDSLYLTTESTTHVIDVNVYIFIWAHLIVLAHCNIFTRDAVNTKNYADGLWSLMLCWHLKCQLCADNNIHFDSRTDVLEKVFWHK